MKLGLHVIKNPAGTYSYVGSLPPSLANVALATKSDVMGGRAYRGKDGELLVLKFPCFKTREDAVLFAESLGEKVS